MGARRGDTPVSTREVVNLALDLAAPALILVHNHLSGDPTPPKGEITVPKDFLEAAQLLGLTVHSDLIIDRGRHTNLRNPEVIKRPKSAAPTYRRSPCRRLSRQGNV